MHGAKANWNLSFLALPLRTFWIPSSHPKTHDDLKVSSGTRFIQPVFHRHPSHCAANEGWAKCVQKQPDPGSLRETQGSLFSTNTASSIQRVARIINPVAAKPSHASQPRACCFRCSSLSFFFLSSCCFWRCDNVDPKGLRSLEALLT